MDEDCRPIVEFGCETVTESEAVNLEVSMGKLGKLGEQSLDRVLLVKDVLTPTGWKWEKSEKLTLETWVSEGA